MAINKYAGFAIVGLSLVVVLGYFAYTRVDTQTYPDFEIEARAGLSTPTGSYPHEFVGQSNSLVPLVNMPHRYPNVVGGNVTALIHHGMAPLRKRAPRDAMWIECPPAEVMY